MAARCSSAGIGKAAPEGAGYFAKHAIANAQTTTVEAGAQILADGGAGGGAGTGGNVVGVVGQAHGVRGARSRSPAARKAAMAASSRPRAMACSPSTGTADRFAPKGKAGTLLLDPEDLEQFVAGDAGASTARPTNPGRHALTGNVDTVDPDRWTTFPAALATGQRRGADGHRRHGLDGQQSRRAGAASSPGRTRFAQLSGVDTASFVQALSSRSTPARVGLRRSGR